MICSTSWHLASLLQLSDGNASTALHSQPAGEFDLQKSHCVSNSDHKSYINLPRCVVWRTSGYE